jgi:magnesium-transporting ATPase (P-type)
MVRIYCKGAPDYIFQLCSQTFDENGELEQFTLDTQRMYMEEVVVESISKRGLKTLAFGYKDMSLDDYNTIMHADTTEASK